MANISVVGRSGKMAQSVIQTLQSGQLEHRLVEVFHSKNPVNLQDLSQLNSEIVVDCSLGAVFLNNLETYLQARQKVVVVSSNWYENLTEVKKQVANQQGCLIYSDNFALGNFNYKRIIEAACKLFAAFPEFDLALSEEHHLYKKDYPSAVAKEIAYLVLQNTPYKTKTSAEPPIEQPDPNTFYTSVLRRGQNTINHTFYISGEFEDIEITHRVRSRQCFTEGILYAIDFISLQKQGIFDMQNLVHWLQKSSQSKL